MQNCLFKAKVEVYIGALLHNMMKLEASSGWPQPKAEYIIYIDIGHARHKPEV